MKGSPKSGLDENTLIKAYEDMEKSGKTPISFTARNKGPGSPSPTKKN
jgi:hypothetical protein